jgi:hypothetical protein
MMGVAFFRYVYTTVCEGYREQRTTSKNLVTSWDSEEEKKQLKNSLTRK